MLSLAGSLRRHGEEFAGRVGQTQARWQLLSVLSDGPWTVPQAARRLGVSRQAVQRVADDLDREGLVRYAPNTRNRRSPLLELPGDGGDALIAITTAASNWHGEVARVLDAPKLRSTRKVLRQILDHIADAETGVAGDRAGTNPRE